MLFATRIGLTYPRATIATGVLFTCAFLPGLFRLTLRTDGHALIPATSPEIKEDAEIRTRFDVRDPVIILISSPHQEGVFNERTLQLVVTMTKALKSLPGVRSADVFSLATEQGFRVFPGTLNFRTFLDPFPQNQADRFQVREDVRRIGLYTGTLVSRDGRYTAIMVGCPPITDRIHFVRSVGQMIGELDLGSDRAELTGAPVAEALLGLHLMQDLGVPARWLDAPTISAGGSGETAARVHDAVQQARDWFREVGMVPIAMLVMSMVFLAAFRRVTAMVLPLLEVGACLVVVFGLMGYTSTPVYLTVAVLPVILTSTGVADEIHIFSRYRRLLRDQPEVPYQRTLTRTMEEMTGPVVKTSLTTAVGFLAFAAAPLRPVQAFGFMTALGITFCLLWSLTVIPASLMLLNPSRILPRRPDSKITGGRPAPVEPLIRFSHFVLRHRMAILGGVVIVLGLSLYSARRVVVQDSWIDGFAPGSTFRATTERFNEEFHGMHQLMIEVNGGSRTWSTTIKADSVGPGSIELSETGGLDIAPLAGCSLTLTRLADQGDAGRSRKGFPGVWSSWIERAERTDDHRLVVKPYPLGGPPRLILGLMGQEQVRLDITRRPLLMPDVVRRTEVFEEFLRTQKTHTVGGVIGTADYLATTNLIRSGMNEDERRIPDQPERIEWLWEQYGRIRTADRRRQVVDDQFERGLITLFLKKANFQDTGELLRTIADYERDELTPHGLTLTLGGDVAVSQSLIRAIVSTQIGSLGLSFLGSLAVMTIINRSLFWGMCCLIPCGMAVIVNFGVMAAAGIPLGVATSMFSSMVIGIGDDFAIHLIERVRHGRAAGRSVIDPVAGAVGVTGPAILCDGLGVGLGFSVLWFSQVPPNARLGALLALSVVSCLMATLIVLPAVLGIALSKSRSLPVASDIGVPDSVPNED